MIVDTILYEFALHYFLYFKNFLTYKWKIKSCNMVLKTLGDFYLDEFVLRSSEPKQRGFEELSIYRSVVRLLCRPLQTQTI